MKTNNTSIKKSFIIGDEWLYYKIYCGVKTADTLLVDIIEPLCNELSEAGLIDKWFFIRYSDPNAHLRIRFHLTAISHLVAVVTKMKTLISPYIESKQIWDISLATYNRELERYGANTIEVSETFFFYDSRQSLTIIKNAVDDTARFLCVFQWVEYLIALFKFETKEQLEFLKSMQSTFKEEFRVHKAVTKELNIKYKNLETALFDDRQENKVVNSELENLINNLLTLNKQQLLKMSIVDLLSSYIHMSINRNFRSKQRLYEMMIYDFLYKKNQSKFARYGKL